MKIFIDENAVAMGKRAAEDTAERVKKAVAEQGYCRILLSTGASQFEMFEALEKIPGVPWEKVTMFHLDEFVGMPVTHKASFRKYLTERFVNKVHPGAYYFVNGEGDVKANIAALTEKLREKPIDVALIGIGENGHIAFNDPPADFDTTEAYIVVHLDERCRKQQMGEGWFKTLEEVPTEAVSMTVYQIMQAKSVLSVVGGERKAEAVKKTLESPAVTNLVPATKLREHPDWVLYLDKDSAAQTAPSYLSI